MWLMGVNSQLTASLGLLTSWGEKERLVKGIAHRTLLR